MKKKITLTESELIGVVKRIAEQVNLNDYSAEDFYDVFFQVFRQWVSEKLGEDAKKYPMSLLLKKYGPEFAEKKGLVNRGNRSEFDSSHYSLEHYGKELVRKSHYSLPSLYAQEKFTDKYKKVIPHFVQMLELRPFISLEFIENEPNRVWIKFNIDFDAWMKYPERISINEYSITDKLKKIFENFGGVEFGNAAHGEVELNYKSVKDFGADEWVKKVLNKQIKKEIKSLPNGSQIHSIRFKPSNNGANIQLIFKDRYGWSSANEVTKSAEELVKNLGYGPNLKVQR